jgi:hypothetical protein
VGTTPANTPRRRNLGTIVVRGLKARRLLMAKTVLPL